MTDMDIVERLRTYGRRPHRICLEAAEEIERLRDELRSIATNSNGMLWNFPEPSISPERKELANPKES